MTLSAIAVPSVDMRDASHGGTRPPCSGRSAMPERFTRSLSHGRNVVLHSALDFTTEGRSDAAGRDPRDRATTLATRNAARYSVPTDWGTSKRAAHLTLPALSGPTTDADA